MTEDHIDIKLAFAFLIDLKKKFLQSYEYDAITSSRALQLKEFNTSISQLMVFIMLKEELLQYESAINKNR